MKRLKIFPKIFLQTFIIIDILIILIHLSVFFVFPKTYLETRKKEITRKADEIASNSKGKDISFVKQALEFYSNNSEIKAFVKEVDGNNNVKVGDDIGVDYKSENNSVILEERKIRLKNGKMISVHFVSSENMQEDAKRLSLSFLPYSIIVSVMFSLVVSYAYARSISKNVHEIVGVAERMAALDRDARLKANTSDEIGQLKNQINYLYETMLGLIDDLEEKNEEIVRLEKLKYDFFRGRSHELKTPLASLKIILENMKYNIGKYKNKDLYISNCIDIVDELNRSISQLLFISSYDQLSNDEEYLCIKDALADIENKYAAQIEQKHLEINIELGDEKLYIGRTALKIVLSNLMSNATKYNVEGGYVNIGVKDGYIYFENSCDNLDSIKLDRVFEVGFSLDKENGNGIGLYVVGNILSNYGIEYKMEKNDGGLIFLIKLNSED